MLERNWHLVSGCLWVFWVIWWVVLWVLVNKE